ncbi:MULTISPECIES: hypothetical protein [Vibrio harveyi group]|uniref:hypothetical protein n=1 Tax=Vibrio harveyi group TaxID=717610 RepID=UPI00038E1977|nr:MULTISPECIES: hypothetical protein [Vibrio harveyi group]EJG1934690.1 hypothetical protein [Vibrio parahaemolyticus]EQM09843.1 hypothetical protein D045_3405 [Vibrio parahaemolyticus VP-NY4]ETT10862.1 hypothetical protein D026_2271 [Vibrio parahaemolyticus 605]EUC23391.1 hypothetical protein D027_3214 [Vibrio parahaemolyticus 861]MCW7954289.1 hypothetical protein [Vibrio parahaemolyticus]
MTSSWYRRGTVTVTDGSKEVVGVGTLWMDAGNKPLAGDIMLIAGGIYEVESITDNEHLSLFRAFNGVPPANGEYAIIRNTSVTIATRVAAMVASAINSKQVLIDDLRGYYTSTADKVLIHTDDGSTIEVVPLQTLVSDITKLIDQSESIKDDLVSTDAALSLIRKYSNAAQGVEVEPGMYSAKSYALDASDTLALVNKAKNDVYAQAGEVHETKTDIEQFVSTSKTEIDAKATAISKAIDTQATTVKGEITALTSTSKQEIAALATQSKKDITTLTTTSKSEINTLVSTSKTEITELATTEKAAISQQSTTAISEMNSLKQSAEQAASTATQKATQAAASATSAAQSKTDSQALKTQTEALANETKQVAEEIKSGSYVGWQIYCQSEANMKAARMLASEQFAASGFVHMGTQHSGGNTVGHINEGLWSATAEKNVLKIGRGTSSIGGSSKTNHAVTHIAGFISSLYSVNRSDPTYQPCEIKFPEAPNGTVVYDSTGNCRGSGKATLDLTKDVDPKYGNVATATNEAVGRAFEGQVKNGDFRLGTESWRATYGGNAFSVADGVCTLTSGNSRYTGIEQFVNKHITGLKYDFELTVHEASTDAVLVMSFNNEASGNVTVRASELPKTYRISGILAASAGGNCRFYFDSGDTTAETFKVSGFSWKPVSEEVVINRVDMFGFEYFLEEISKANPFVYPYGCIQSKLTSIEGIATKESNRPITYYSVFDGDTTSKGKGVDFWAATDDQKRALVSNPDHNIYLLDDGRLVQWRVRQRTIAGAGNGKWFNLNPAASPNNVYLQFTSSATTTANFVKPQGKREDSQPYALSHDYTQAYGSQSGGNTNKGVFKANHKDLYGVDGQCYFLVCGVVPRLNQGVYHPSFNPMGADKATNVAHTGSVFWYELGDETVTTLKTFLSRSAGGIGHNGSGWGSISSNVSGRPDGRFYDAIYASGQGGVIDYRTPAKDMSSKEEASKIFQKVVNGTYRGEETLYGSKVYRIGTATTGFSVNNYRRFDCASVTDVGLTITVGKGRADNTPHNDLNTPRLGFIYDAKTGGLWKVTSFIQDEAGVSRIYTSLASEGAPAGTYTDLYFIGSPNAPYVTTGAQGSEIANLYTNIPASGNFFQQDVIGSPANILTTPALANGWIGSWNPKFHTNYNTIVGTRKNVLGAVARRYTDNLGTAWGSDSPAWDSAKNTFVASSLQPTGRVEIWEYTAFAKQAKSSVIKRVLNGSEGIGDVTLVHGNSVGYGVLLGESLMGKVITNSATGHAPTDLGGAYGYYMAAQGNIGSGGGSVNPPKHQPIAALAPTNDSPAVKALWYQTAANQQCSLNFAWNELVYKPFTNPIVDTGAQMLRKRGAIYLVNVAGSVLNGRLVIWNGNEASIPVDYTAYYVDANNVIKSKSSNAVSTIQLYTGDGWGDDSTIRIIDGIGTFINLNGDTCLYGTHELAIPYGYIKNKARAGSQVSGVDL